MHNIPHKTLQRRLTISLSKKRKPSTSLVLIPQCSSFSVTIPHISQTYLDWTNDPNKVSIKQHAIMIIGPIIKMIKWVAKKNQIAKENITDATIAEHVPKIVIPPETPGSTIFFLKISYGFLLEKLPISEAIESTKEFEKVSSDNIKRIGFFENKNKYKKTRLTIPFATTCNKSFALSFLTTSDSLNFKTFLIM